MITINYLTLNILVPRADLTLVQALPTEIREMDLDWFRMELKSIEDSEEGVVFDDTHIHNTEVTFGGLTFARTLEIINGYTVTFEDGQYAVNLVGANSNVGDVVNVNQVSIRPHNSAGLISSPAIEHSSFNGGVTVDVNSGNIGTLFPRGTERKKIDNIVDGIIIAKYRGFNKFYFDSDITLGATAELDGFILCGQSDINIHINIEAAAKVHKTIVNTCTVSGVLDGENHIDNCIVGKIIYMNGHIRNSSLTDIIALSGGLDAYIANCSMSDWDLVPTIDMGGYGQNLIMTQYTGKINIKNMSGFNKVGISLLGGEVMLDSTTITSGLVSVVGTGRLVDELGNYIPTGTWNNGVIINNGTLNNDTVSESVWNHSDGIFLKDIEDGGWKIINNQMIFYKDDNVTEISRFDLFDENGNPNSIDVFERRRV